jgi:hypothetical protein
MSYKTIRICLYSHHVYSLSPHSQYGVYSLSLQSQCRVMCGAKEAAVQWVSTQSGHVCSHVTL